MIPPELPDPLSESEMEQEQEQEQASHPLLLFKFICFIFVLFHLLKFLFPLN